MDRGELASFLDAAERTSPMHAALAVLLGLNGRRVSKAKSKACGANVEDLGFERGHRTLQVIGKVTKPAGILLVPRTARTLDLAIGERVEGPRTTLNFTSQRVRNRRRSGLTPAPRTRPPAWARFVADPTRRDDVLLTRVW